MTPSSPLSLQPNFLKDVELKFSVDWLSLSQGMGIRSRFKILWHVRFHSAISHCNFAVRFRSLISQCDFAEQFCNAIFQCNFAVQFFSAIMQCDFTLQFHIAISQCDFALRFHSAILQCNFAVQFCSAILQCNFAVQFCSAILQCNLAAQFCSAILQCNFALRFAFESATHEYFKYWCVFRDRGKIWAGKIYWKMHWEIACANGSLLGQFLADIHKLSCRIS